MKRKLAVRDVALVYLGELRRIRDVIGFDHDASPKEIGEAAVDAIEFQKNFNQMCEKLGFLLPEDISPEGLCEWATKRGTHVIWEDKEARRDKAYECKMARFE